MPVPIWSKLRAVKWLVETVNQPTERAVPVCGHLGLTPQSSARFSWLQSSGAVMKQAINCSAMH
ncbi:3-methyl-2-oxobutanoate hydroxymethyltransferase [Shigella flexneri]